VTAGCRRVERRENAARLAASGPRIWAHVPRDRECREVHPVGDLAPLRWFLAVSSPVGAIRGPAASGITPPGTGGSGHDGDS